MLQAKAAIIEPRQAPATKNSSIAALVRRLTLLGRDVTAQLYDSLDVIGSEHIAWVAASRHGDPERMVRLLRGIAKSDAVLPNDFSFSVHNAIIGSFSIATQNQQSYTAVAAGEASFSAGLIEALCMHKTTGKNVGYVYYDGKCAPEYEGLIPNSQAAIILMILGIESDCERAINVNIEYNNEINCNLDGKVDDEVCLLTEYIKNNNEKYCKIQIPSGQLSLERSA